MRFLGFTLIEMLTTLAVIAILGTIAVPGMQTFILNQRISGQVNELIGDLNIARSEAIRRASNVSVCRSNDPNNATPACNAGSNWTTGRVIFLDINGDGVIDAGDTVLRVRESLDGSNNTLKSSGGTDDSVTFSGNGMTALTAEAEWKLCDGRGASHGRAIAIQTTGRARATAVGKDKDGNALSCT